MKAVRIFNIFIIVMILTLFLTKPALAGPSNNPSEVHGGFHLGFSPYSGIIGAELQRGKYSLTLGLPASIGLRYYFNEQPNSWFVGAHALYYDIDEEETIEGIRYDEKEVLISGMGTGHKWRFKDHWDLVLSLSLVYKKEEFRNSYAKRTEESIGALPGITIGYTF